LSHYLETTNFEATDIKAAEQILRTARDEWRRFHPVDRKAAKALESRFEGLQSTLHQQIKDQWDRNLELKRAIVADAQALIDSSDPVSQRIETAKDLQRRWRDAGPVPRRPDQQLWQEFRGACDAVFALRDAQKQAADAAVAAARASARQLLDEFTTQLEIPTSDRQKLRDIEARFNELQELPERDRRELERQFESLRQTHRSQQRALAAAQQAQALETALMQEEIPGPGDTSVSEDELRRLVVEAEIAAELDSAPEDRDLRMSIQVEMMNQGLGSQRSRPDPQSLVTAWLETGSKPAGSEALRDRLKYVLKALVSH